MLFVLKNPNAFCSGCSLTSASGCQEIARGVAISNNNSRKNVQLRLLCYSHTGSARKSLRALPSAQGSDGSPRGASAGAGGGSALWLWASPSQIPPFPPSQESGTLPVGARQAGAHTCECHTEVCGRVLWWDSRVCPWGSATPASRTARAPLCSGMSSRNVTGRGHRDQLVPRPLSASVQPFPPQEPPCRANSELRTSTDSTCRHCPEVQRTAAELWGPGCRCPCISPLTALCEEAGPARAAGSSWGRSRVTSGLHSLLPHRERREL